MDRVDDRRLESRLDSAPPDLLAALVESLADAVYLIDAEGTVRFVNRAGLQLLGYDDEHELLGHPSHATIHHSRPDGSPFPEEECPLLRPRTTGETVRVEEDWFARRDGTLVPVAYSSAPVASPGGRGAVVVFRDVSQRRAAEAERRRAEAGARVAAAADEERRRLGRDLHDGAQSRLVHVALGVHLGLGRLDDDPAAARELLTEALAQARTAIDELRELAAGIHPTILTDRGLPAAIDALTARAPVAVEVDVPGTRFPPPIEAAAYFVIAEALTNVSKHAKATTASITVRHKDRSLIVEIADDGQGGATGLSSLHDRVETLGGTLEVDSPAGGPTRLRATLPL